MSNGQTLRRCRYYQSTMSFSSVTRNSITHEDGSQEIPITSVDLLMPESFLFNFDTGNLNKGNLWQAAIEELDAESVKKRESFNRREQIMETVYEVPIVGYKLFLKPDEDEDNLMLGNFSLGKEKLSRDERKIKMNPAQYMFWEGKYYDVNMIYAYRPELSNFLVPIAPLVPPRVEHIRNSNAQELTKVMKCYNARGHSVHHCGIQHDFKPQQVRHGQYRTLCWTQEHPDDYLEINLGYPRYLTHIGTAGAIPNLGVFPTRKDTSRRRMRRSRRLRDEVIEEMLESNNDKRSKFAPFVQKINDESSCSWVTEYDIYYRDYITKRWVLIVSTPANTNSFEERVLDFKPYFNGSKGLFTQYLRVKPTQYHRSPCMRVAIYGIDPYVVIAAGGTGAVVVSKTSAQEEGIEGKGKSGKAKGKHLSKHIESGKEEVEGTGEAACMECAVMHADPAIPETEVPTVEYVIAPSQETERVRDGLWKTWRDYDVKNPKAKKKQSFFRSLKSSKDT